MEFEKLLEERYEKTKSLLCVGLDPHFDDLQRFDLSSDGRLTVERSERLARFGLTAKKCYEFCREIVEETSEFALCYKPQSAFFESIGGEGIEILKEVIKLCHEKQVPVLLDVKRGDIDSTAAAYAKAAFEYLNADAVTVNALLGSDCVKPFVTKENAGKGCIVLAMTSNKSADEFQPKIFDDVMKKAVEWRKEFGNVGVVIGATQTEYIRMARKYDDKMWILCPGVGFQDGSLVDTVKNGGNRVLVSVSRGISRAKNMKEAARQFCDEINKVLGTLNRASIDLKMNSVTTKKPCDLQLQQKFLHECIKCGVLKFDEFTLKSGRKSPYFFNSGLLCSGSALAIIGECFANIIVNNNLQCDVVFGPAYKGISFAASTVIALSSVIKTLSETAGAETVGFAYDRKEVKDHGEGGVLVGADMTNRNVILVDDVITSGLAIRTAMDLLSSVKANVKAILVAMDRQEMKSKEESHVSAVSSVEAEFKVPVYSVINLDSLIACLSLKTEIAGVKVSDILDKMIGYRAEYSVR